MKEKINNVTWKETIKYIESKGYRMDRQEKNEYGVVVGYFRKSVTVLDTVFSNMFTLAVIENNNPLIAEYYVKNGLEILAMNIGNHFLEL